MKRDPYQSEAQYRRWQQATADGIPGVSSANSACLRAFLADMEIGRNISRSSKKGGRSFLHLNALRTKLSFLARLFSAHLDVDPLTNATESHAHACFSRMRNGEIRRRDGEKYKSTGDYVKVFKTFWHWHMKVKKRGGQTVVDICEELDTRCEKPRWVYLTEQEVEKLCRHANYKYQVLIRFLYDSGIRAPTELVNVRVRDLTEDCTQLHIREETSKTFGRKITLLHCPPLLREYIHDQGLKPDQYIFDFSPSVANRYLKALGSRVLGDGTSAAGKTYPELTLYDFRHSSACYWRPKYKHESAFMHRFGWTTADMVAYYTEFLGMHDTITDEDLLTSEAKTALERQLGAMEREKALVDERIAAIEEKLHQLLNRLLVDRRPDEPELLDPMLKPR